MATNLQSDDDDLFEFEADEKLETAKQAVLEQVRKHSLEQAVRRIVPVDIVAIFEIKYAEETIDRCSELRNEILSFIEIAFDSRRPEKIFINFPRHNLSNLKRLLKPFTGGNQSQAQITRSALMELKNLEPRLSDILKPLFAEEAIFYEQLSEILKNCLMGKALSDTEKHIFSTD